MAARSLRAHAFRSALTVLGITVGAFAIVLMTSLAQSGLTTLKRSFEELGGARLIFLVPKQPEKKEGVTVQQSPGFTLGDRDLLFERVPHLAHAAMYIDAGEQDAFNAASKAHRTKLFGGDRETLKAFNLKVARGRNLTPEDGEAHARVCVVAWDVVQNLFDGDALGKWLTVGGVRCRVVGELGDVEHWGMNFGFSWKNFVVMPLEVWHELNPHSVATSEFMLQTTAPEHNDLVKRVTNALLVERHNGVADFQLCDFGKVMKEFNVIFSVMQAIVGLVASIALLVGGIGVMNMMLVSVSERVREIGIRKALGARQGDIQRQFLVEAGLLAGSGGAIGVGGGVLMALLVNFGLTKWKATWASELSVTAIVLAMVVSLALGIGFGFFPARKAARLEPVQAIRS